MPNTERLTVTLPAELAADVEAAVEAGDYPTPSAVVNDALQQWKASRTDQAQALARLRADIQMGLDDLHAGRVVPFDPDAIIERGKALSRSRSG